MSEPIGSIIAFAGIVNRAFEASTGWLHCDGRLLDATDPAYAALFNAIEYAWGGDQTNLMFNIPDLRGYFLRGVDRALEGRDPDSASREPNHQGGAQGRSVGSVQKFASARPVSDPFYTEYSGLHSHTLDFELEASRDVDGVANTVANPWIPNGPRKSTDSAGGHSHTVLGGDKETRPINAYVHWIIRFK